MNQLTKNILIIALIVLTLGGIALGTWSYISGEKYSDEKTIELGGSQTVSEEMEVRIGGFVPGVSADYTLHLKANQGDAFHVALSFKRGDTDALARFLTVAIYQGETLLTEGELTEYLDGKTTEFDLSFTDTDQLDIRIIYTMHTDVGDEAQGTSADFEILFESER